MNDFRKENKLYDYHADVIDLLDNANFIRWDTRIVRWPNSIGQAFAKNIFENKYSSKTHEYCLISKKPDDKFAKLNEIKVDSDKQKYPDNIIDKVLKQYENTISRDKAIELLDKGVFSVSEWEMQE